MSIEIIGPGLRSSLGSILGEQLESYADLGLHLGLGLELGLEFNPVSSPGSGSNESGASEKKSSEKVLVTGAGGRSLHEVLLDNQASLHVFKNDALVNNIVPMKQSKDIGGIDGTHSGMSTAYKCTIPGIGKGYFNRNAVANIVSWSPCVKNDMNPDYFREF